MADVIDLGEERARRKANRATAATAGAAHLAAMFDLATDPRALIGLVLLVALCMVRDE